MKALKPILLSGVLLLANSGIAGSIETGQTTIVPGVSIAGVSLGPNGRQELKKLGKADRIDVGMSQSRQVWKWVRPEGRAETFFIHTVSNDVIDAQPPDGVTIDLIRSTAARFHTAGGIAVGSTLDQIRMSFPDIAPVDGTPTVLDDVNRGIAFEFSGGAIGHSVCIAIMVHPAGKSNIATQEQVAEVLREARD